MILYRHLSLIIPISIALSTTGVFQSQKQLPPSPLRMDIPFDAAWDGMLLTLTENNFAILRQNRSQGSILSDFREYSSGPLTERHIGKIGTTPKLVDGEWLRVQYQYEVVVELITERETVLTVYTNISALKRTFLGVEDWITIEPTGKLETELLMKFGKLLFGGAFSLPETKKSYQDREPVYVPNPVERIPKVIGPERIP